MTQEDQPNTGVNDHLPSTPPQATEGVAYQIDYEEVKEHTVDFSINLTYPERMKTLFIKPDTSASGQLRNQLNRLMNGGAIRTPIKPLFKKPGS